jgi:hypothetical protein
MKIFINFRFKEVAYGGGNQFVKAITNYISLNSKFEITYYLEPGIDIYFLIDLRKDGKFKNYDFEEIYNHSKKNLGQIIYRINDCDITRSKKSLEELIIKNLHKVAKSGQIDPLLFFVSDPMLFH